MKPNLSTSVDSDFWFNQADMLFSYISNRGIAFVLQAPLDEIERVANTEFLQQNQQVRSSIVTIMRDLLKMDNA